VIVAVAVADYLNRTVGSVELSPEGDGWMIRAHSLCDDFDAGWMKDGPRRSGPSFVRS
jgi:hypothetical protein